MVVFTVISQCFRTFQPSMAHTRECSRAPGSAGVAGSLTPRCDLAPQFIACVGVHG